MMVLPTSAAVKVALAEENAAEAHYGHSAAEYAVELAQRAGVARVALFHHRPNRTDDEMDVIAKRFEGNDHVVAADESLVIEL